MRLADNIEEYGVSLNNFSPQTIQHMILVGYISKLEISVPEFASCRQDVLDLSKLIVFSLLYKQFDRAVFSSLIECSYISTMKYKIVINNRTKRMFQFIFKNVIWQKTMPMVRHRFFNVYLLGSCHPFP